LLKNIDKKQKISIKNILGGIFSIFETESNLSLMKKIFVVVIIGMSTMISKAQNDIDVLLAAGVEDAQRFANDHLAILSARFANRR